MQPCGIRLARLILVTRFLSASIAGCACRILGTNQPRFPPIPSGALLVPLPSQDCMAVINSLPYATLQGLPGPCACGLNPTVEMLWLINVHGCPEEQYISTPPPCNYFKKSTDHPWTNKVESTHSDTTLPNHPLLCSPCINMQATRNSPTTRLPLRTGTQAPVVLSVPAQTPTKTGPKSQTSLNADGYKTG